MRSNSERRYEVDSYDKAADHIADSVFETLNIKEENNSETKDINPTNNKYNAVHIAKTGRKAISHGANRIPWGPGSAKLGVESLAGRTLGWEKLSPAQRKLYGLWSALSLAGWGLWRLWVHTGHLRLWLPLPVLSTLSSALIAAAQASMVWWDANIGKIFKAKINEYISSMKKYLANIKDSKIDQQSKEQIATTETSIQEVENIIHETTDTEATNIAKEVISDLPESKNDEK